jgi:hypothetical protein
MAVLADVVKYFKTGKHGRPLPLDEVKQLTPEERAELVAELAKLTPEELAR